MNVESLLQPRVAAATMGIAAMLTVVGAVTHHRERKRLDIAAEQQAGAVAVLEQRIAAQSVTTASLKADSANQDPAADASPSKTTEIITRVQSFAEVLDAFRSHGVRCLAADSVDAKSDVHEADQSTHRITLTGDFFRVQDALRSIHEHQPHALLTKWSMKRAGADEPCVWELAFRFSEVIP